MAFFAWILLLQGPLSAAGQNSEARETVIVSPIDGPTVEGSLLGADSPWTFLVQPADAQEPVRLSADSLDRLHTERSGPSQAALLAYRAHVYLANGDHLPAQIGEAADDSLRARSRLLGELSLPWEAVAALSMQGEGLRVSDIASRRDGPREDTVVLTNGDSLAGTVLAIDPREIELDSTVGQVRIIRGGVASVLFNPELTHVPAPEGLRAVVWLSDGSRLTISALDWSGSRLVLLTPYRLRVAVAPSDIERMQFFGGRVVYLSDLQPTEYEHAAYLSVRWPYERDRSVGDNPLQLTGMTYAKGLGMHSASRLTYRLDGRYLRFEAVVGIDDETGDEGSAIFRVIVDGQERYASPIVRGTDKPLMLEPIDITGARQLQLLVDHGDYGDVRDHADWADARLIRVE